MASYSSVVKDAGTFKTGIPHRPGYSSSQAPSASVEKSQQATSLGNITAQQPSATREWRRNTEPAASSDAQNASSSGGLGHSGDSKHNQAPSGAFRGLTKQDLERNRPEGGDWRKRAPENAQEKQWRSNNASNSSAQQSSAQHSAAVNASSDSLAPSVAALFRMGNTGTDASVGSMAQHAAPAAQPAPAPGVPLSAPPGLSASTASRAQQSGPPGLSYPHASAEVYPDSAAPGPSGASSVAPPHAQATTAQGQGANVPSQQVQRYVPPPAAQAAQEQGMTGQGQAGGYQVQGLNNVQAIPLPPGQTTYPVSAFMPPFTGSSPFGTSTTSLQQNQSSLPSVQSGMAVSVQRAPEAGSAGQAGQPSFAPFQGQAMQGQSIPMSVGLGIGGQQGARGFEGLPSFSVSQLNGMQSRPAAFPSYTGYSLPDGNAYTPMYYGQPEGAAFGSYGGQAYGAPLAAAAPDRQTGGQSAGQGQGGAEGGGDGSAYTTVRVAVPLSQLPALHSGSAVQPMGPGMGPQGSLATFPASAQGGVGVGMGMGNVQSLPSWQTAATQGQPMNTFNVNMTFPGLNAGSFLPFAQALQQPQPQPQPQPAQAVEVEVDSNQQQISAYTPAQGASEQVPAQQRPEPVPATPPVPPEEELASGVPPAKILSSYKLSATRAHASQLARRGQVWMSGETKRVHILLAPGPVVRPRQTVRVYMHGPFTAEKSGGSEWLCLYRAGRGGSQRFTAAKEIKPSSGQDEGEKEGGRVRSETIIAPRLPGVYELLLFSSDMDNVPPVGRSMPLLVTAQGKDLSEVLYFQHAGEKAVPVQPEREGRQYGRGFRGKQGGDSSGHAASSGVGAAGSASYVSVIDALTTAGFLPATEAEQVRAEVAAGPVVVRNKDKEARKGPGGAPSTSSASHSWTHPALDAPATGLTPQPTGLARAFAGYAAFAHAKEREQAGQAASSNVLKHSPPSPPVLDLSRLASSISHVQQTLAQVTSVLKRPVVKSAAEGGGYRRRKFQAPAGQPHGEGRTDSRSGFNSLQQRTADDEALLAQVLSAHVDEEEAEALIADLPQGVSVVEQIPEPDTAEAVWRIVRDVYISALICSISYALSARQVVLEAKDKEGKASTPQGKLCADIAEQVQVAVQQSPAAGHAEGSAAGSLLCLQPWLTASTYLAERSHELTAHGAQVSRAEHGDAAAAPPSCSPLLNLYARFVHVQAIHSYAAGCLGAVLDSAELRACLSPARMGALQAWCDTWEPLSEMFVLGALPVPSASAFVGLNTSGGAPGLLPSTAAQGQASKAAVGGCTKIALQLLGKHSIARELAADSWLSAFNGSSEHLASSVGVALDEQEGRRGTEEGKGKQGSVDVELAAAGARVQDLAYVNKAYAQLPVQKRQEIRDATSRVLVEDAADTASILLHSSLTVGMTVLNQQLKDHVQAAVESSENAEPSVSTLESVRERAETALQPLIGLLLAAARAVGASPPESKAEGSKTSNDHRRAAEAVTLPTLYDSSGAEITQPLSAAQIESVVRRYKVKVRMYGLHALVAAGLLPTAVLQASHSSEAVSLEVSLQLSEDSLAEESPLSPDSEATLVRLAWAHSSVNAQVCKALQHASAEGEGGGSWSLYSQATTLTTGRSAVVSTLDSSTGLYLHISPMASLAMETTALLGTYLSADARVVDSFVLLQQWASARGLLGTHLEGFTSHALLLALIAHGQRPWTPQDGSPAHPLLPCLQSLPLHWPFMDAADATQARQRIESAAAKGKGGKGQQQSTAEKRTEERKWILAADGTPYNTYFWSPSTCIAGPVVGAAALSAFADRCTATTADIVDSFMSWLAGFASADGALASLDARLHTVSIRPEAMRNSSQPRAGSHAHVSRAAKQLKHGWRVGGAPLLLGGSPSSSGPSSGAPCITIEDPLEADWDVAGSVSGSVWRAARSEATRAHLLLIKAAKEMEQGQETTAQTLLASVFSPSARSHAEPSLRAHFSEELRKAARASAARARKAMVEAEAAWMAQQAENQAAEEERAREASMAARAAAAAAYGARSAYDGMGGMGPRPSPGPGPMGPMGGAMGMDRQGGPMGGYMGGYGGSDYRAQGQGGQMGQQGPFYPGPQAGSMPQGWGGPDRQWMAAGPNSGMTMGGPGRGAEPAVAYLPGPFAGSMQQQQQAPQQAPAMGDYPSWNAPNQSFLRPVPGYGQGQAASQWAQQQAAEASRPGDMSAAQQAHSQGGQGAGSQWQSGAQAPGYPPPQPYMARPEGQRW